jgi:glycosyltransferase involved in cell wall biosynthesis
MSFALLEAMAQGLAIVAANGSSNPEALAGAGLLFEPGDETSLVEAIRQLSADEALRQSLGARAKARALEQFSPASFLDASREVYVRALERRQG